MHKKMIILAIAAGLLAPTFAFAGTYTYTISMQNQLNKPFVVMDGVKAIGTVGIRETKSFAFTNVGNTVSILIDGKNYCSSPEFHFNPFDLTLPLQFGKKDFRGIFSGQIAPKNTRVNCSVV